MFLKVVLGLLDDPLRHDGGPEPELAPHPVRGRLRLLCDREQLAISDSVGQRVAHPVGSAVLVPGDGLEVLALVHEVVGPGPHLDRLVGIVEQGGRRPRGPLHVVVLTWPRGLKDGHVRRILASVGRLDRVGADVDGRAAAVSVLDARKLERERNACRGAHPLRELRGGNGDQRQLGLMGVDGTRHSHDFLLRRSRRPAVQKCADAGGNLLGRGRAARAGVGSGWLKVDLELHLPDPERRGADERAQQVEDAARRVQRRIGLDRAPEDPLELVGVVD